MRTLKLLLGGYERRINGQVEVAALDVCYDQAAVEFTRTHRASEFLRLAAYAGYDLIIVAPDFLLAEGKSRRPADVANEVVQGLRDVRQRQQTPILALGLSRADEARLWDAGADHVLSGALSLDALKLELRSALRLPERAQTADQATGSLSSFFARWFARPRPSVTT
jgi:DNA-binding response OmpR family regulator